LVLYTLPRGESQVETDSKSVVQAKELLRA